MSFTFENTPQRGIEVTDVKNQNQQYLDSVALSWNSPPNELTIRFLDGDNSKPFSDRVIYSTVMNKDSTGRYVVDSNSSIVDFLADKTVYQGSGIIRESGGPIFFVRTRINKQGSVDVILSDETGTLIDFSSTNVDGTMKMIPFTDIDFGLVF